MSVFANKVINRAYLQTALRVFADNAGGAFSLVCILKAALPRPRVIGATGFGSPILTALVGAVGASYLLLRANLRVEAGWQTPQASSETN